ncbi:MAG: hypothetical protein JRE40_04985 [Deltaproteobacteria bacterium]|nr:hypothetical protein [Deltaproteobacteria bacterium]
MELAKKIAEKFLVSVHWQGKKPEHPDDIKWLESRAETLAGEIAVELEPVARWMIEMHRTTGITNHDDYATRSFLEQALNLMFGHGEWEHVLGAIDTKAALARLSEREGAIKTEG